MSDAEGGKVLISEGESRLSIAEGERVVSTTRSNMLLHY